MWTWIKKLILAYRKLLSGIFLEKPTSSELRHMDVETSQILGRSSNNCTELPMQKQNGDEDSAYGVWVLPTQIYAFLVKHVVWFHVLKVVYYKSNIDMQSKRSKQPQSFVHCHLFLCHLTHYNLFCSFVIERNIMRLPSSFYTRGKLAGFHGNVDMSNITELDTKDRKEFVITLLVEGHAVA
jgi:hypothetical protein